MNSKSCMEEHHERILEGGLGVRRVRLGRPSERWRIALGPWPLRPGGTQCTVEGMRTVVVPRQRIEQLRCSHPMLTLPLVLVQLRSTNCTQRTVEGMRAMGVTLGITCATSAN